MIQTLSDKTESLQDAFQVFNDLSQNLISSYLDLESQVERLSGELAAARSERLRTLDEKAQLANRLQRLLETLPGGVLVTDGQGLIREYNAVAVRLLGEHLSARPWRQVLDAVALPSSDNPHQRHLRDGRTINLSLSALGEEPGHIVLITDVSENRALQELVNQQKRLSAMGEMVASLAHQIRTPLSTALLYASHLTHSDLNAQQRERFSSKLSERLMHMERQVNDLLAFARLGRLSLERIRLGDLIGKACEAFEAILADRPIYLETNNAIAEMEFFGNPDALLGVLLNLLNNAVEAAGVNPVRVQLDCRVTSQRCIAISVCDDGPGIAEEIQTQIFEPFFTTRPSGTGLGLAVVDCVTRAHGGRVFCQSTLGQGARFIIELPVSTAHELLPSGFSGTSLKDGESLYGHA